MVSERQRQAKKKYREAHPELFPTPEPTPPKDPNKKKKKKPSKLKPNKAISKDPQNRGGNPNHRKHPMRIPGMKPGESCFICKGHDHIAKNCPEKVQWEKHKICLLCRYRGHSLKNCPNKYDKSVDKKLCYNCGQTGHTLDKCPLPLEDGGTKFASCFICNESGHLSKNCPKNTHGIYPKGGCCKICESVTHLARDCPNKANRFVGSDYRVADNAPRGKVTKLFSGDDLEDDFTAVEDGGGTKDKSSEPPTNSLGSQVKENNNEKPKMKKGPKVVNFVG